MNFSIWFCKDGILRAKIEEKEKLIPITALQKYQNLSDLKFWFTYWDNYTFFEKGLTIKSFLECLEPWSDFWSDYTGKNIKSYIRESRKNVKKEKSKDIDWIQLTYSSRLNPKIVYERNVEDVDFILNNFENWLKEPKNIALSGVFEMHSNYTMSGYKKNEEEFYSTDFINMGEMRNTPIVLNNKSYLIFENWPLKRYYGKTYEWVTKKQFGICEIKREQFKINYLIFEHFHSCKDVINGFFTDMYQNPYLRDDILKDLNKELSKIDKLNKNNVDIDKNIYTIGEESYLNVDLSEYFDDFKTIDKENNNTEELKEIPKEDEKEDLYIDSNGKEYTQEEFEDLVLTKFENNIDEEHILNEIEKIVEESLLLEEIEEAEPLENRIESFILKKEDINSLPNQTDFKKEDK